MEIQGRVIKVIKQHDNGKQILQVELNTNETSDMCSVSSVGLPGEQKNKCASCSGCSAGGSQTGVFAVKGNVLDVLNDTNKTFKPNDRLIVFTTRKKQILQSLISLGIPVILAVLCFVLLYSLTKSEGPAIAGLFVGLIAGALFALLVSKLNNQTFLPRVKQR